MDWDKITQRIADLARPFTFYSISVASSIAVVKMSWEIANGYEAAALAGTVLAGASAIYIGKAIEVANVAKHNAAVAVEKVKFDERTRTGPSPGASNSAYPGGAQQPGSSGEPDPILPDEDDYAPAGGAAALPDKPPGAR